MLLKNLMEDKQLDFYQPLLSVRRFSSTAPSEKEEKRKINHSLPKIPPLPSYRSELKSGPIRNAGTVPFVWEKSPGRPKDESRPRNHVIERPPIAPKLPPGRILKTRKQDSDNNTEHPVVSKHRGEIPYRSHSVSASNENVTKHDSSKDTMEVESSDSGEGDEAYLDALDTLSRSESFFLNCSVSGISGLDGSDVNTSGNFSTDPQTRDFMMGRFLPAAKAMTSETPQYVPRKPPVVREQPRQMMKVRSRDKRPPLRYGPNIVPHYAQEKDEEESDDDYDEHGQLPSKVCGLLPRFCLKSSFCLLNPVPGMSVRTRIPMSPSSRTHGSSSSAGSCSENENTHIRATVYEQRSVDDLQAIGLQEDKSVSNKSDQLSCPLNPQKLEGSALYRRLQGSGMPPHHNELPRSTYSEQKGFLSNPGEAKNTESAGFSTLCMPSHHYELPRSAFSEQKGVLSIPGEAKNAEVTGFSTYKKSSSTFQELLADPSSNREVDLGSPMIEKTLYVDIVHKVESPSIYSYTSDTKGLPNLRGNALNNLEKSKATEETPSLDSSFKDTENSNVEDEEANLKVTAHKHVDFSEPSLDDKSNQVLAMKIQKGFVQYEDITEDFTTSAKSKVPNNVNMDFETQQPPKAEELEKSNGSYFPIPPPLPKSPSDSWLWRTLPSMSSRTPSLRPHFGTEIHPGNQALKTSSVDPKWGTIVKTTKEQRQYDMLTSIQES